jgi:hypothetical protein
MQEIMEEEEDDKKMEEEEEEVEVRGQYWRGSEAIQSEGI